MDNIGEMIPMEEQRVRICDIAEELGVSTATVSNVIHGKTKKISDETVKRVMERIEERQYIPNMAGILLARNSSKIIGVFINDHEKYEGHTLDDFFISSSLNHLSTEIENSGQFMMVKKAKQAEEIIQFASMWNMEGIVVMTLSPGAVLAVLAALALAALEGKTLPAPLRRVLALVLLAICWAHMAAGGYMPMLYAQF